ncbi:MAG TPA: MFS transporter [Rhizomicrobium sp.]|jgi:GPH family glycoside/pentoside/hexuronide:cation symporter
MVDETIAGPAPISLQADVFASGAAAANAPPQPLSFGSKVLFSFGDTIDGFSTTAVGFHLFYLTIVCGLPGALAGLSGFIALMFDAFIDPLIGSLSDNWHSRHGRRHPFLFASVIPIAIGLGLTFSVPKGLSTGWLFAYVTGVTLLLRVSYSAFTLPFLAMGAELTSDYVDRSRLIVYRVLMNTSANLLTTALGYRVFMAGDRGLLDRAGYMRFGWTIAALLLVTGFVCAWGTLRERPRLGKPSDDRTPLAPRLLKEIAEVFRNRSFVVLFVTIVLFWTAQGSALQMALHLAKFFWALPNDIIQYLAVATTVGGLAGIPASGVIAHYAEKRTVVVSTLIFNCAYQGVLPVMRMMHLLPDSGWGLYGLLMVLSFCVGLAGAMSGIFFQSMMADAADEHELLFGTRREGLYFAGITLSAKAAIATGLLIGGVALSAIGLPQDLGSNAAAALHLSTRVVNLLGVAGGPLPAVISTASLVLMMFYRLDRKEQMRITAQLEARRFGGPKA